jgi:hypothetical protein
MKTHNIVLEKLQRSPFCESSKLTENDLNYIKDKCMPNIVRHTKELLYSQIYVPSSNDGRQTPWKGHLVFTTQHATATCCRKCIHKWHGIRKSKIMDEHGLTFCSGLILGWIQTQIEI